MAERIYTIKSGLKPEPMAAPSQLATMGAAGSVGDVASYNANTAGVPTANVAEVAGAGQTAGRVYRKKSSLTAGTNIPTTASQRTYTPKLSVKREQAQNLQTWFNDAFSTIQSIQNAVSQAENQENLVFDDESIQRVENLLTSSEGVPAYIELYKDNPETYNSLSSAFEELSGYLRGVKAVRSAQYLTEWGYEVNTLSNDVITYFEKISDEDVEKLDDKYVPTASEYDAMLGRIDSALASLATHREAYAEDAEVAAYLNDVEEYLKNVRGSVEKYRDGLKGALYQEMADELKAGTVADPMNQKYGNLEEATRIAISNAITRYRMANADFYNQANLRGANIKALGHDLLAGLVQWSQGMYNGIDWLTPDEWISEKIGLENYVGQFFDYVNRENEEFYAKNEELEKYAKPRVAKFGDDIVTPVGEALPGLVATIMTSGAASPSLISPAKTLFSSIGNMMATKVKQPKFWMSFVEIGGNTYKNALDNGATESQAQLTALLTAFPSAYVEVSGGLENMPKTEAGILAFVKNLAEEGGEEVVQGWIEHLASKAVYEQEKQWCSWTDTDAVFSGSRAWQEFIGGVTVSAVLGGGVKATQYIYKNYQYSKIGKRFVDGEGGVTIDDALAIGLSNAKGTDAYNAAVQIKKQLRAGETPSYYSVGRMVAESQTEQAQVSKAIEREVVESGRRVGYNAEAVDTVARAAVALNQRVRFATQGELRNENNAAEYHPKTGMVLLNPVLTNTDMLIGKMLAHEMTHAAEGTAQLQKLAKIAQRMEDRKKGAGAWESLKADVKSEYAKVGKQLSDPEVQKEALANWIGEKLFTDKAFAKAVVDGDANVGNAFFYMIDRLRRAMGAKKASAGNLAMLERLFMQALDNRTLGPREGDVQGAFMNTASGMANDSLLPYDVEMRNLIEQRGDFVVDSYDKLVEIVNLAFDKPQTQATAYFGIIDTNTLEKIKNSIPNLPVEYRQDGKLFKKGREFSIAATFDNIRHLVEDKKGMTRADVIDYLDRMSDTILEFDSVEYSKHTDTFKKESDGLLFKKRFLDGTLASYNIVSRKKMSLSMKTLYMEKADYIKRKSAETLLMQNTSARTPEVGVGQTSSTNVAQNATDVNTQSMQEGAGIYSHDVQDGVQDGVRGALLPPEYRPGARAEGINLNANVEGDNPSVTADAVPPPFTQGRHAADSAHGADLSIDEGAVLENAVRSQLQGKQRVAVDTSSTTGIKDVNPYLDKLVAELGSQEVLRRMYNATRMDRPTGTVEIDGKRVDAAAYMDAYEQSLPKDKAALERHIERLQEQRTEEMVKLEQEGTLEDYRFGGLKIDLQLFAATRLWDLLQLDTGEDGTEVRQFYEKRLRGTDAIHNQELIDLLAGQSETYNPIANEKTLEKANTLLRDSQKQEKLLKRIGRYNPRDMFNAVEMAAAQVLIKDAINDGEIGVAADLITGLSRKGTEAGRAVQALSMMARLTPEGTLKAAIKTVKADADYAICEGANEGLDVLADDIARAIKEAEGKGLTSDEIADRIRNGVVGKDAPVQFNHVPQDLADQVSEATGTDVTGYTIVVSTEAMQAIADGGANVETLVDTDAETLQIIVRDGADNGTIETATAQQPIKGKKRLPAKLTREELVQLLSEDLAGEKGNFFTQEEIYDLLWKTVDEATNIPEQLKRYVLKKIRKDDGGLAQRIYELHKRGDLKQTKLRRAMEEALELPTLTDEDLSWIVKQGAKIESLQDKPVEQADAMEELYDYLGAKLTVTGLDAWQSWRKFGMLFNVKTHLRNIFSNAAYAGIRKADDTVAMVLERVFVRDSDQRGAALGWRYTKHGKNILPLLQERAELAVLEMQKRGAKYEQGVGMLKQKRKHFGESKVGEALNKANRWNSDMLEAEDVRFFRPAYIDALGQIMTARKATEVTEDIHQIAMQRALEATFRADNAISDVISSLKRFQNESTTGKRLFGHGVDVVIPFHNTPANIAAQTVMHSPVGIVKGAFDLYNAVHGKGSKNAATAINTMAKGVTGTALLIIGMLLGQAGLFNTGFGKTEKERAADEMAGLQEGSFVIGGVSISLDWLQPAASPLIVGASIAERMNGDGFTIGDFFGAVMDGTDSLFEMTMLQSLYDILGGYDAGASGTLMSVGENLISQSVPTVVGQMARAIDPVQRKTKGDSDFETIVNQVMAKIPGLTYLLDPELDVWGNEVYRTGKPGTGTTVLNALQQVLIPANTKVGTGKGDPISEEILRLYATQGGAVIPTSVTRDEAAEMGEDYVDVNRLLGGTNRLAVEEFVGNKKAYDVQVETGELTEKGNPRTKKVTKYYRDMTDDERRKVLSRIYKATKAEVTGDTEGKTESQLTDNERYIRDLLRRVRSGDTGTNDTVDEQAQQQPEQPKQEDTSYYEDLLRRMRNGY